MYPKFKSSWKRPPRIRSSSSTAAAAAAAVPHIYVSKGKRPQSTDLQTSQLTRCRNSVADAPKTSEYAYFKRFKKDLGGDTSHSLNRSSDHLKSSNMGDQDSEGTISANRFEDLRRNILSSFQAKEREPAAQTAFLSPSFVDADNYVVENMKDKLPDGKHGSLGLSGDTSNRNRDVFPFPFASAEFSGNQYAEDGVFPTKRQKLRQLAADSLRDVEGLNVNSKGFDLISTLLNRLFPQDDETKCCQHLEFKEGIFDPDHHPPASPDTLEKSCTLFANRSHDGSLWNDVSPAPWSGRPQDRVLAECDIIASDLCQTKYDLASNLPNKEGDFFRGFDNENTVKSSFADSDFSFAQSFEKLHSSGLHLRELYGLYDPDKPSRVGPYNLLLSLDDQEDKVNPHTTWRNVGHYQTLHDTLDARTRPQLSLWSVSSMDFHSFLDFRLTDAHVHEPWRNHEDGYSIQGPEQFPLHLPSPPRYLTWEADFDTSNHLNNSTIDLPFVDPPQCTSLITNKECVFDGHLVSRGLDIDLGLECFPFIDYISNYSSRHQMLHLPWKEDFMPFASEDKESILYGSKCQEAHLLLSYDEFDTPDWSSASPDAAINKVMGNSLLLDYPSRISYERELFPNDDN